VGAQRPGKDRHIDQLHLRCVDPARAYQHYHGGIRILSETASADLATPVDIPFDHLQARSRGYNPRERSWNFTNPWRGGRWTLRDIVSYQTDGAYALLVHAAHDRERWLANFFTVETRAVRGWGPRECRTRTSSRPDRTPSR